MLIVLYLLGWISLVGEEILEYAILYCLIAIVSV